MDERLGPDEHVEAEREVRLERLPGRVAHLQSDEVRRLVAEAPQHVEGDGVAARAGELVDVERQRRARARGGGEVRQLGRLVEREVRRADDRDRRGARVRRVRRESDRVRRRLRAAVGRDVEAPGGGLDEEPQAPLALLDREEHPLAVRAEREDAVEAGVDVPLDEWAEGVLVEAAPRPSEAASPRRRASRAAGASSRHGVDSRLR